MKVSVVIPTYNRPQLLRLLLQSLESQDFKNFEVLVVDDASRDGHTYTALIQEFQTRLNLKYFRNPESKGAPYSRNLGIKNALGTYVALVDDDDTWASNKLSKQLSIIEKKEGKVSLVYTWANIVDENNNLLGRMTSHNRGACLEKLLTACFIPSSSVLIERKALLEIGGFDESLESCQDWDTWIRLAKAGHHFDVVEEPLMNYLKHSGPTIGNSPRAKNGYIKVYKKHFWSFFAHGKIRHLIRLFRLQVGI